MNLKSALCVTVFFAISVILIEVHFQSTQAQGDKLLSANSLSPPEQELLAEINEVRTHPETYAKYLDGLKPFFKDKEYRRNGQPALLTSEGWAAVEDAISFLRTVKPQKPLNLSRGLSLAAAVHVKDQSVSGATGHKSPNNAYLEARTSAFGIYQGAVGENLSYGVQSARERVLTWLIDDGFASRGHRRRLLSADYAVAGLSCGSHPQYGAMCVLTMAGNFSDLPAKALGVGPVQQVERTNTPTKSQDSKPRQ
jgi:uncharacterized protein YkwD